MESNSVNSFKETCPKKAYHHPDLYDICRGYKI